MRRNYSFWEQKCSFVCLIQETAIVKDKARWALENWNITFFLVTVFLYFVYILAFGKIGTWITWDAFSDSWYWLFIACFPLTMIVHIVAMISRKKHAFKILLASFILWFLVQGVTVGSGV